MGRICPKDLARPRLLCNLVYVQRGVQKLVLCFKSVRNVGLQPT